jgi:hypothetical protein
MKFKLILDAGKIDQIHEAICKADDEGAEFLNLVITGTLDKSGKAKIDRTYLEGECVSEYHYDIRSITLP